MVAIFCQAPCAVGQLLIAICAGLAPWPFNSVASFGVGIHAFLIPRNIGLYQRLALFVGSAGHHLSNGCQNYAFVRKFYEIMSVKFTNRSLLHLVFCLNI